MTEKESCPTKIILMTAWQNAAEIYSKAVAELSKQVGTLSKSDYARLRQAAHRARQRSIEAQTNLDSHIKEHGCDGHDGEAAA